MSSFASRRPRGSSPTARRPSPSSGHAGTTPDPVLPSDISKLERGQVLWLPTSDKIPAQSTVHADLSPGHIECGHIVIVSKVEGGFVWFHVTSSFSDGKTAESNRPFWASRSLPIRDPNHTGPAEGMPQLSAGNAKEELRLADPKRFLTKCTFVRTDKVFKIEGTNLEYWNRQHTMCLDRTSVELLEKKLVQQGGGQAELRQTSSTPAISSTGRWSMLPRETGYRSSSTHVRSMSAPTAAAANQLTTAKAQAMQGQWR